MKRDLIINYCNFLKVGNIGKTALTFGSIIFLLSGCMNSTGKSVQKESIANWEKIGPGGGGSTFIPTFSYNSPDNFLVKCDMTGSYLTKDGGNSFRQINFENGAVTYAYDPKDSNTIYVGSTFLNKSTDGGKSWQQIFPGENNITQASYNGDHASFNIKTNESSLYDNRYRSVRAIRVDPLKQGAIYFSMGPLFFHSSDAGKTWQKEDLKEPVNYIYTNSNSAKNEVYIATPTAMFIFNKSSRTFTRKDLPKEMSPAFSFTAGTVANSDKMIFYALHHDPKETIQEEFGHTEVWSSEDQGETWKPMTDPSVTNSASGIKPSYSTVSCAEFDAGQAYLVCNRYEEKKAE